MKKFFMLSLLLVTMIVTGCGGGDNSAGGDSKLSVMLGSNIVSLDSAQADRKSVV